MTKRMISVLLTLIVLTTAAVCGTVHGSAAMTGDVDADGSLTIFDATAIQRYLADMEALSTAQQHVADVDADQTVTIFDVTMIQRRLADMIDAFPADQAPTEPPTTAPTQAPTEQPTQAKDEVTKVKDTITVYFSNNRNWSTVNAYIYNNATGTPMTRWPGSAMKYVKTNDIGERVYSVTADVTKYDRIIFHNNNGQQTTDTPLTKASSGYFINGQQDGKLIAGLYPYGREDKLNLKTVTMSYPDGYQKAVYIWLPDGYNAADKSKRYSVLYMCDGQNLFGQTTTLSGYEWECDESVLSLMQNGGDGVIVVGIACGSTEARRNHELTPNLGSVVPVAGEDMSTFRNGGGKVFSDFVIDTVIPYVEANYNTNSIRGIAGSSSGGIEAFYIGMEHMDKFRYVGALSPAFLLYDKATWDRYLSAKDFSGDVPRVYFFNGNGSDLLEKELYKNATAMQGWMQNHGYPADRMITVTDNDAVHSEAFWALYFPEMLSWGLEI